MKDKKYVSDFPEVAKEWDWEKNPDYHPDTVTAYSEKKIYWLCPNGHSYAAVPGNRIRNGSGCPYCKGKKVLKGYNDLASQYPEIAKLWNYERNNPLRPDEITTHSNKKVWWKCAKGHEWRTTPNGFVDRGGFCPKCSSSLRTSLPEQAIAYYLKSVTTVQHQKIICGWEVDVYLPDYSIAIEYDGVHFHSNSEVKEREPRKNAALSEAGITTLRVKEAWTDTEDEPYVIYYNRTHRYLLFSDALRRLFRRIEEITGDPINVDVDFERDRIDILASYKSHIKKNSLVITNPELIDEWDYVENKDMLPEMFSKGSGEKVHWICEKNHHWTATISSRAKGAGCPYCSGFMCNPGKTDIQSLYPEVAKTWDTEKNNGKLPSEISAGTHTKYWWKCEKGHSYQASPLNRTSGKCGCPYCSNKKVLAGYNDLRTHFPEIAAEWNYEKNAGLLPTDCAYGSYRNVWWKCSACGFEWQTRILNRTRNNSKCPNCKHKR